MNERQPQLLLFDRSPAKHFEDVANEERGVRDTCAGNSNRANNRGELTNTNNGDQEMILRKKKKQFQSPKEGWHVAVLAGVEDLGEKQTPWSKQQRQVRFRWFVQEIGNDGKQLSAIATYNASLNENSNLVEVITKLTGTRPDDGFDTDTLIGTNARINIEHHKTVAGNTFPKIVAYLPLGAGDPVLRVPDWYKRARNGNNATPPVTSPGAKAPAQHSSSISTIANTPATENGDDSDLPPEPDDLDACDDQTSFPGDNAKSGENAA